MLGSNYHLRAISGVIIFTPNVLACLLAITLLPPSGCDQKTATAATPVASPVAPVQTTRQVYTPLSADQLYQLVSPIALFPDQLLAQVLAGEGYPDQISAADNWLGQNRGLQPAALSNTANGQPGDSSIRSLVLFPDVIDQMAKNIAWTTQLGNAYLNDPTDVMHAIQVMRQRASHKRTLKNTPQQACCRLFGAPGLCWRSSCCHGSTTDHCDGEPSQPNVLFCMCLITTRGQPILKQYPFTLVIITPRQRATTVARCWLRVLSVLAQGLRWVN